MNHGIIFLFTEKNLNSIFFSKGVEENLVVKKGNSNQNLELNINGNSIFYL